MCGNVPENIHDGGSLEFPKGRGILKTKIFKVQYEPKLEFPVGSRGLNQKTLCGGVQIFSGTYVSIYFIFLKDSVHTNAAQLL